MKAFTSVTSLELENHQRAGWLSEVKHAGVLNQVWATWMFLHVNVKSWCSVFRRTAMWCWTFDKNKQNLNAIWAFSFGWAFSEMKTVGFIDFNIEQKALYCSFVRIKALHYTVNVLPSVFSEPHKETHSLLTPLWIVIPISLVALLLLVLGVQYCRKHKGAEDKPVGSTTSGESGIWI